MSKDNPIGLTSEEAAALFLSDGRTKNVEEAQLIDRGQELSLDGLTRAALRRNMGFDFEVKVRPNKLHVFSTEGPRVTAHAKVKDGELDDHQNIISQDLIDRLVNACLVLKQRHEAATEKAAQP